MLIPNSSEAVNRIVDKAVEDIEKTEDKTVVVETARRKFLILFKEDSDQYVEAYSRLLHATDPHLFTLEKVEGTFPMLLGEAESFEELDDAFNECNSFIDRFVTVKQTKFPFIQKIKLRFRLKLFYELRRRALLGQPHTD